MHADEFEKLNERLAKAALAGSLAEEAEKAAGESGDARQAVENLLHPRENPLVLQLQLCDCETGATPACEAVCLFNAIHREKDGTLTVTGECTGCGRCLEACEAGALAGRKDMLPLLKILHERKTPVYAMIAPAFSGQYSAAVTSGRLRSAFKQLGFYGMMEVALFADILTLKEALEFDRSIHDDRDFVLTSCCCPMWVALIRKKYADLIPHVPPSVSPMVACGRSIKRMHPEAVTVFVGPCLAKKAEAKEADIADAVDVVLTFDEVAQLFSLAGIDPASLPEDASDHSSRAGRIYARTGGVSEAVRETLARIQRGTDIPLRARQADGIVACKEMLAQLVEKGPDANFIEGMGCKGGCVGGPKRLIPAQEAAVHVNRYGDEAASKTPADNPDVLETLRRLGYETVESLLDRDSTFTRTF